MLIGHSFHFHEDYSDAEATNESSTGSAPGHTPSRRHSSISPYQMYPYQREWQFHSRQPLSEFSTPDGGGAMAGRSGEGTSFENQVESLLQSQKAMMKKQEELVGMVKGIAERVVDLEKVIVSKPTVEEKKLPPALSVSLSHK